MLLMQVLRDCRRLGLHEPFLTHLAAQVQGHPRLAEAVEAAAKELIAVLRDDTPAASLRMRPLGARLAWL